MSGNGKLLREALKFVVLFLFPFSFGTLYFLTATFWSMTHRSAIGVFIGVDAVLSIILYLSGKKTTYDGSIIIEEKDGAKMFSLNLDSDPLELEEKDKVIFKVKPPD